MKKYMLLLPSVLYVGSLYLGILPMLFLDISEPSYERTSTMLFSMISIFILVTFISGIVCNILAAVRAVKQKWNTKEVLRANLLLKYLYLPLDLLGIFGFVMGIMGILVLGKDFNFMSLFLFLGIGMCAVFGFGAAFHSGSIAIAGILRAKADRVIAKKEAVLYGIGSFIVVADIVVAHLLSRKVKKG
ncbi:MAG: hypothetical protein NC124_07955 [Clostridium sp.]|nr:hypothetical protein [Clostridium sp.]